MAQTRERKTTKNERLAIRTTAHQNELLAMAAEDAETSVSAFVLESAISAANDRLADRTRFRLDSVAWDAFMEALDAPVSVSDKLNKFAQRTSVLESDTED